MKKIYFIFFCLFLISCKKDDENLSLRSKGKIKKITFPAAPNLEEAFFYNSSLLLSEYKYIDKPIVFEQSYLYENGKLKEVQNYKGRSEEQPNELIRSMLYYFNGDDTLDSTHDVHVIDNKKVLVSKCFYEANTNKQIIRSLLVNLRGDPGVQPDTISFDYGYDNRGNIVTIIMKRDSEVGGSKLFVRSEYTYDNNPNPFQFGSRFNFSPTYLPIHLSPNNIIREVDYSVIDNNKRVYESQQEYEYGLDGKPVKDKLTYLFKDGTEKEPGWEKVFEYY